MAVTVTGYSIKMSLLSIGVEVTAEQVKKHDIMWYNFGKKELKACFLKLGKLLNYT